MASVYPSFKIFKTSVLIPTKPHLCDCCRVAVNEEITTGSTNSKVTVIEDLKAKQMYVITKSTKSCIKLPLPNSPMFPSTKPCTNNFTFLGSQKLGMTDEALDVNVYQVKSTSPYGLMLELYLTKNKCLPVFESFMAAYPGASQVQGQVYSDVTLGIKDPSVFDLPEYCKMSRSPVGTSVFVKDAISRHHARRCMWA